MQTSTHNAIVYLYILCYNLYIMSEFGQQSMQAPRMGDILRNPDEMLRRSQQAAFVTRYGSDIPRAQRSDYGNYPCWIEATTEAAGLQEVETYLHTAAEIIGENDGNPRLVETARRLQYGLHVVMSAEISWGIRNMAENWISRVQSSSDGELAVFAPANGSEGFIFWQVHQEIARTRPDIAQALRPFNSNSLTDPNVASKYAQKDIIIPDDWTMTGDQMGEQVEELVGYGLSRDKMELHYICAAENHLGGIQGVPVRSTWTYPALSTDRDQWVSLVGSTMSADYGFNRELSKIAGEIDTISRSAGDDSLRIPLPGFYTVARIYKAGREENVEPSPVQDPAKFAPFNDAVASYQQMFPIKKY